MKILIGTIAAFLGIFVAITTVFPILMSGQCSEMEYREEMKKKMQNADKHEEQEGG